RKSAAIQGEDMFLKLKPKPAKWAVTFAAVGAAVFVSSRALRSIELKEMFGLEKASETTQVPAVEHVQKPAAVHGIHLTAWGAGSKRMRVRIDDILDHTEINTVVIAVKEY